MEYEQILSKIRKQQDDLLRYKPRNELVIYIDFDSLCTLKMGDMLPFDFDLMTLYGMKTYEVKTRTRHINVAEMNDT